MIFEINLDPWCIENKVLSEPIDRTCKRSIIDNFYIWMEEMPGMTVVLVSF